MEFFLPPTRNEPATGIPARVIVRSLSDSDDDNDWPDRFLSVPRVGEQVRTSRGRTLTVLDVVHAKYDGKPELHIEIGVSNDSVTPTEGGAVDIEGVLG